MHTPRIDLCKITDEPTDNIMIKQLLSVVNDSAPGIIHKCPYTVEIFVLFCYWLTIKNGFCIFQEISVQNASAVTTSFISVFPTGDYKLIFYFFNEHNETFTVINIIGSMMSSNKDTFG